MGLLAERQRLLNEAQKQHLAIIRKLDRAVSPVLHRWMQESGIGVTNDIIEHGTAIRCYKTDDITPLFGLTSLEDFQNKMRGLQAVWSDEVEINVYVSEDGQEVNVEFRALK